MTEKNRHLARALRKIPMYNAIMDVTKDIASRKDIDYFYRESSDKKVVIFSKTSKCV